MQGKLFGTDGVRGTPGRFPLDQITVQRLAASLLQLLQQRNLPLRLLLAGDTRHSTAELASWFAGAFVALGGEVVWGGVLPTPAVSHLLRRFGGFGAGVVISASHNPAGDNGIKVLGGDGVKLSQEEEAQLEAWLASAPAPFPPFLPPPQPSLAERYLELLLATLPPQGLSGLRVVVDGANGATSEVVGRFFSAAGARVHPIHCSPNGHNINHRCGALHPEVVASAVRELEADAGVALDGDGDRAILVTHRGRVLNGDDALLLWARSLAGRGLFPTPTVVATVMSNAALEVALGREGVRLVRCSVGDREVWEAMQREGAVLGGEQSGHVICAHYAVTGDGLLTAAHLLAECRLRQRPLEELADLQPYPQVLLAVPVKEKRPLHEVAALDAAIREANQALAGGGRLLVRYSGTEALLRIMVEAGDAARAQAIAEHLAQVARQYLT